MISQARGGGQVRPARQRLKALGEEHLVSILPRPAEDGRRERVTAEVCSWVGTVFLPGRLVFEAVFEGLDGEKFLSASGYGKQPVVRAYVTLTAAQLLDYRQFQAAVLEQFGLFFSSRTVERAPPWVRDAVWRGLVMARVDEGDVLLRRPRPGDPLPADNGLWSFWLESREPLN
jgi:hypothetical protein